MQDSLRADRTLSPTHEDTRWSSIRTSRRPTERRKKTGPSSAAPTKACPRQVPPPPLPHQPVLTPRPQSEWERYKKVCAVEGVPVPDHDALVAKIADINKLVQRKWTEQELSDKLKRQNDLHVRFSGIERDSLQKQLDAARLRGDDDALVARLQDRLDGLETPRLAFKTSLAPQQSGSRKPNGASQQEKLARLNAENRKRNAESVRKAQLVERHKARETNRRLHHHDEGVPSGAATPAKGAASGADTPGGDVGTPNQAAVVMPHIAKLQELQNSRSKNGIPTVHRPLMDDDVIGALDLDIDLEID
jgi:RNA polymerase-associated protein RTF1